MKDDFYIDAIMKHLQVSFKYSRPLPDFKDIRLDVDFIYKLYGLQTIIRFHGQKHWERETASNRAHQGALELENVAAHSFQVARSASLLAPHFPWIDAAHATELALVHDEPELMTGDKDPVGEDGQGNTTHAFDHLKRMEKNDDELKAIEILAATMRSPIRERYKRLFTELIEETTDESLFVKAVDKLQSLAFVRLKKAGAITPEHAAFTVRYARTGVRRFPPLQGHFLCILGDILNDVKTVRPEKIDEFGASTMSLLNRAR